MRGLSLVAVSRGSLLRRAGFSLQWLLLLRSTGSRRAGFSSCGAWASVVVAHGLSCSVTCGVFLDQGSNPCPLHWQVDSQPLCHQGSPTALVLKKLNRYKYVEHAFSVAGWGVIPPPKGVKTTLDITIICDPPQQTLFLCFKFGGGREAIRKNV